MPANRVVMETLPWLSIFWSTFELMRNGQKAGGHVSVAWILSVLGTFIFVVLGIGYDTYKAYDKLDWRHCLKINDYNGTPLQKKGKLFILVCYPPVTLVTLYIFAALHNTNFAEVFSFAAFPVAVIYFSMFKILPHNPNMLTLEQFEKFCEKHNYTVPEETSFVAKMSSTSAVLATLHVKMVADIYGSKPSSSEMEMAGKTS